MSKSNIIKFTGLVVFIAIMVIVMVALWPTIIDVFSEQGIERLVERVQNAGASGVGVLLGMQFLQIVVAFIPGEVVQLVAGVMYGPWLGALIIIVGCVISSSAIYLLVHKLGAPFVQEVVPDSYLHKFQQFEKSGKLDVVVFILFLIPGMPKDVFTYIVPLTEMPFKRFILLTTIGRIPGIFASTYAASGFTQGDIVAPIIVLVIFAILAILGIIFRDRILEAIGKGHHNE